MTERQPHDGLWLASYDVTLSTREGVPFETYESAKAFANANGIRCITNGTITYRRGADSFWYRESVA